MRRPARLMTAAMIPLGMALAANAQQPAQIDPVAMTALEQMGTYLRSLTAFQVDAETRMEEVLEDGQKVQFEGVTTLVVRPPDRLRISVDSDRQDRLYLYDGRTFTLLARAVNYYATVPAPPTIVELVDVLDAKYGLSLPLEDLFWWGGPRADPAALTSAMFVGPSEVGG